MNADYDMDETEVVVIEDESPSSEIIVEDDTVEEENEFIKHNPDGTVTVYLQDAIEVNVRTRNGVEPRLYNEVKFRKHSFGDLKAVANLGALNEFQRGLELAKRLACIPAAVFDKISGDDVENCMEAVGTFFTKKSA